MRSSSVERCQVDTREEDRVKKKYHKKLEKGLKRFRHGARIGLLKVGYEVRPRTID